MLHPLKTKRGSGPSDEPDDRLLECHGRMRGILDVALRLASAAKASPAEVAEAAAGVKRYFDRALPLHEEDEERSIAPRLLASVARAEVEDALGVMEVQHRATRPMLAAMDPLWRALADDAARSLAFRAELLEPTRAFDAHLRAHLAMEEARVIPILRRALPPAERAAIVVEMRARREGT